MDVLDFARGLIFYKQNFFNFYIIIFNFSKIYADFFLQIFHPAAGSSGRMKLPPDEPAVGERAHGLTRYRRR